MKPRLIVFTKAPVIGGAKSRLAAGIGKVPAWRVYRAMLATLTRKLRDSRWDLVLAVAPDRAVSRRFPGAWPDDLARMAQGCGDLGARQARVFTRRITPPRPSPQGEGEARSRYGVKRGRGGLAGRHKQLWFSPRGAGGQRRRAARLQAPLTEFRRFRQSAALQASLPPPWGRAGVGSEPSMDDAKPHTSTSPAGALRLPDYLPYRLSVVSNKASGLIARAYQARFGLTIWEWRVIAVLGEGRALTAQAVCEATAMDKVTVSRAIRALDTRGLLTRTPSAQDRRASDVTLTAHGRAIYADIAPLALTYEATLLDGFSTEERAQLMALLEKLEARLDARGFE
jgi:DNA-binding MarR family transcriptional regulator